MLRSRHVLWVTPVVLGGTALLVWGIPRLALVWLEGLGGWGLLTWPLLLAAIPLALYGRLDRRRRRASGRGGPRSGSRRPSSTEGPP